MSMQVPLQAFLPLGHCAAHCPCWQDAVPPVGTGQGSHDDPQVSGLLSLTHFPSHAWFPDGQATPQAPPIQVAAAFPLLGQAVHDEPHALASSSRAQRSPHR